MPKAMSAIALIIFILKVCLWITWSDYPSEAVFSKPGSFCLPGHSQG